MSGQDSDQEKTEEPTQRKLEKAREEGNVSVSTEISSVLLMFVSVLTFLGFGGYMYNQLESMFTIFFMDARTRLSNQETAIAYLIEAFVYGIELMVPILIVLIATALIVNVLQTQGAISTKAMEPKAENINPISGLQRIFSMKGLVELAKGVFKLLILGAIAYFTLKANIDKFVSFAIMPLEQNLSVAGTEILIFLGKVLAALLILAIADVAYQQYQHKEDLKMTKQEVKDERKQTEGDPHVKNKRKEMGMSFRQKRLDHAVLESDVVVTNPTHYAIGLQYNPDENQAPIVTAKGQRLRALKIKELAKEHDVPVVENKPVAQALFASAEVDEFIPEDLYRAVAEILAYVYKLKNKHKF